MEKTLCLYRANTLDGMCAALVMSLGTPQGSVAYGKQAPVNLRALREHYVNADTLYLLGYGGGDMSFIVACCAQFERVVLIDHHRRSLDMLGAKIPPNFEPILASTQSTSMQCVAHFRPTLTPAQTSMLAYVEDYELKRYALPETRAFIRGVLALNVCDPQALYALNVARAIEHGHALLCEQERVVGEMLEYATFDVEVLGVRCRAMEYNDAHGVDAAASALLARHPPMCVVARIQGHVVFCAFRSSTPEADTTMVTRAHLGGGQPQCSGCTVPLTTWEKWKRDGAL